MSAQPEPFADPADPRNGPSYHTGAECVEPGCQKPAGTKWSPHWCRECNAERMRRIERNLQDLRARLGATP